MDTARPRWRDTWQIPILVVALMTLIAGVVAAVITAPKPDVRADLAIAQQLVDTAKYGEALDHLNKTVLPGLSSKAFSPDDRRTFHLLRARSLYLGQRQLGINRAENNESIRAEFVAAEHLNAKLEPEDACFLAGTLISLGDLDAAAARAERLPDSERGRRIELIKRMVDLSLHAERPDLARALDLVTVLAADAELSREDRAWTLARQGELLIAQGYAEEAITKILRALPRLDGTEHAAEGELRLTLAKAYLGTESINEARAQLDIAAEKLGPEHTLTPQATLLQAEIDHQIGELASARERYTAVLERSTFTQGHSAALLGLAEVESQISTAQSSGPPEESLERYSQLVDRVLAGSTSSEVPRERVGASLMSRFREQFEKGDLGSALRYATLAERLFGIDLAPADVLLAIAETKKRQAEELLSHAAEGGALSLAQADPATQKEARECLVESGRYFRHHASRVVREDSAAYAESLWHAADAFDRAGNLEASVQAFHQFTTDMPGDKRRPEAAFRLARGYQARGDLELAAKTYQALIDGRGGAEGTGSWGDRAVVPLAQSLLADADTSNDTHAEQLLAQALAGEFGGPGTETFRLATRELGEHLFRTGRYAPAVERFEQYLALAQSDDAEEALLVRYRLADAYRRSAAEIARALESGMPDGTKRTLEQDRRTRLGKAAAMYEQVRGAYEAMEHRSAVEDLALRNAYFFKADCAFDLKDFDAAIRHYDAARERYAKEPAALMALTQIVSALVAQGHMEKARAANDAAKRFYASLPDSAWDDPTLPMSKADWERWLSAQDRLAGVGSAREEDSPR
ncbi:hypothetical protein PHYC_02773 [Phycisphaerales bacterium]|nr:hypothetical protein PHYC_02773 [Phycisphaerales bacterium]